MAVLTPAPKMQFFDINGEPLVGGKVYTYEAGTTTPLATYTDNTGTYANPNPVILNARGEASIWLGADVYKFKLTDVNEVEIWTVDYISAPISGVSPVLSGNVVINSESSAPALKITQTGTGYAIRVQDDADPDSTPFVVSDTGRVGVGTAAPSELVDISGGNLAFTATAGTLYAQITPGATLTDIAASGARALTLSTNSTPRIHVTSGGLVGIGKTPAVNVELDVLGDIAASGNITATTALVANTISERTAAAGVTIDGVLCKDNQVAPANRVITAATAQATTSGTFKDFTSIPTWVKRITVMFDQVSLAAADSLLVQIGTSGIPATSGYQCVLSYISGAGILNTIISSAGFLITENASTAGRVCSGIVTVTKVDGNTWVMSSNTDNSLAPNYYTNISTGRMALGGALDIVRITSVGGSTFDGGSVNILYE